MSARACMIHENRLSYLSSIILLMSFVNQKKGMYEYSI